MSSYRRDPPVPGTEAPDETDDGYLIWFVAGFIGIYLLVMIPIWRVAIAAIGGKRRRRITHEPSRRPALSETAVFERH